ncbi:MAG: class I SAM-dependent methyltransferase [Thermomicrobiales bacterium]
MDWTQRFYSRTGRWWGPAESCIGPRDHQRRATIERLCGPRRQRILDLGSSYGTTAAVLAHAGHEVVGVEISERIDFARQYERQATNGSPRFVRADFYEAAFDEPFDVVCYWNGFGIGDDADQRRLLRRIAGVWLKPDGVALIDVANPTCWINWAGDEENRTADPTAGYAYNVSERTDFDPVRNRFVDTWWQTETPSEHLSQSIRCYAPLDFLLLLEGTGLKLDRMELDGEELDVHRTSTSAHPLWTAHEYLVKLSRNRVEG